MKKLSLLITILFIFSSCEKQATSPPDVNAEFSCEENAEVCELTADNNVFGFELLKKLQENDPDENIFISPLSISAALSMTVNGAEGETKAKMLQAMELEGWNLDHINQAYKTLLEILPQLDDDVLMQIANSIWYRKNYNVRQEFLNANETYYGSEVNELDFDLPEAVDIINGWVEGKTNGLIDEIITEIPGAAIMYLINAIYFKGTWLKQFETDDTSQQAFYLEDNSYEMVDMMKFDGEIKLPYFETENFQAVDLAYGDSIFSMSIFLPKGDYTASQLINDLEAQSWNNWMASFQDTEIVFQMPKFKIEYKKKLNRVLEQLGMGVAFTDSADFSGINGVGGLKISKVIHKSFIEVDEAGTEAAAVTLVEIVETSVPSIPYFIANKPFFFVIRDAKTNGILFAGKLLNPNEG